MVLEYLRSRARQPDTAEAAMTRLAELDRAYLLGHLRSAHSTFFGQGTVVESFVFCLFDAVCALSCSSRKQKTYVCNQTHTHAL
jgi:hypothetical protein